MRNTFAHTFWPHPKDAFLVVFRILPQKALTGKVWTLYWLDFMSFPSCPLISDQKYAEISLKKLLVPYLSQLFDMQFNKVMIQFPGCYYPRPQERAYNVPTNNCKLHQTKKSF